MRAVLTLTALAAASLLGTGSAAAAAGSKSPLALYGYHLYGQNCLGCHGPNGSGRYEEPSTATGAGPGREQKQQGGIGPSLRGVGALAADFYLRTGYMPLRRVGLQPRRDQRPFFSDHQIKALVAYVASFGGPPIPTPTPQLGDLSQGQSLFTERCAGCHQIMGQGGYVTGAIPPALVAATPREVAEAVRIGPYVMPKFSRKSITDRQLDSIVRYVEYTKDPQRPGGWALGYVGPVPEGLVTWFLAIPALLVLCLLLGRRLSR
jgi:ubiquinol-cytochrome c reductase cytochrome c subunit